MNQLPSQPSVASRRILLLEPASVFRDMQALLLEGHGYTVGTGDDPHAAVTELAREEYNVLLINTDDRGAVTTEFLELVRHFRPSAQIVLVADHVTPALEAHFRREGVALILSRPLNPYTIASRLAGLGSTPWDDAADCEPPVAISA